MERKINEKILSLPPYISTEWKNVTSLQVETKDSNSVLIIELATGSKVHVPNLDEELISKIFRTHAAFLESLDFSKEVQSSIGFTLPFRIPRSSVEGLTSALEHNSLEADTPDLPMEVLEKIDFLGKNMSAEDLSLLPTPEQNCNCPHCQIMRALKAQTAEPFLEEDVKEEDLSFRTWDVFQQNENLYKVTNPIDSKEEYTVFLGSPIGCNCGNSKCEHIQAVLKT